MPGMQYRSIPSSTGPRFLPLKTAQVSATQNYPTYPKASSVQADELGFSCKLDKPISIQTLSVVLIGRSLKLFEYIYRSLQLSTMSPGADYATPIIPYSIDAGIFQGLPHPCRFEAWLSLEVEHAHVAENLI